MKTTKRSARLEPIHPGEVLLEEFIKPMNLSANHLAIEMRVPSTRISEIAHGRRSITAETALRLARYFRTTAEFWVNLQAHYDLEIAEDESAEAVMREVTPMALRVAGG